MDAFELRWPEGETMQPGMLLLVVGLMRQKPEENKEQGCH